MKDKILKVFILFLIFAFSISLFFFLNKPLKCKVLKVVEADEFILDFNGNNRIDDNETVKLKRVTAFKMTKNNLDIEFKFIDSKELFIWNVVPSVRIIRYFSSALDAFNPLIA